MKEKEIPLKIIVRGLPPFLTQENFNEIVNPLPLHNYFRYVPADTTLGPNATGRCYIKFMESEELFKFMERYNRYVFIDSKGHESMAFVEYAPFQKVPKSSGKKPDPKAGLLRDDTDFKKFEENLEAGETDKSQVNSIESYLEEIKSREKDTDVHRNGPKVITPLIEYVRQKKEERRAFSENKKEDRRRYEERRRAMEEDKRRMKEAREQERREQKTKASTSKSKPREEDEQNEEVSVRVCENPERRKSKMNPKPGNTGSGTGIGGSRSRNGSYRSGSFDDNVASGPTTTSVRRSGHRPESYFESRSKNKNVRSVSNSSPSTGATLSEVKKESANESSASTTNPISTTKKEKVASATDKSDDKDKEKGDGRPKPRRADRPIYNPAERIAERQRQKKQQQQQKDLGKSDKT